MLIRDFLRDRGVSFQILLHNPAGSASRLAGSLHVSGRQVAKGVLVKTPNGFAVAVLPAVSQIDLDRLSIILDASAVRLGTEDEIETIFGDCERGALPPFGSLYGLKTLVDASLAADLEIVCMGNARHEGVRLGYADFEAIEKPSIADFAITPVARARRTRQRRAG